MFYDYTVLTRKGEEFKLSNLKGKVVLVVNTATGCGFTPQYAPIEQLYQDYHDQGLEILDIPCNQFGGQAPGTDDEIHAFCTLNYKTTFRVYEFILLFLGKADYFWMSFQPVRIKTIYKEVLTGTIGAFPSEEYLYSFSDTRLLCFIIAAAVFVHPFIPWKRSWNTCVSEIEMI